MICLSLLMASLNFSSSDSCFSSASFNWTLDQYVHYQISNGIYFFFVWKAWHFSQTFLIEELKINSHNHVDKTTFWPSSSVCPWPVFPGLPWGWCSHTFRTSISTLCLSPPSMGNFCLWSYCHQKENMQNCMCKKCSLYKLLHQIK